MSATTPSRACVRTSRALNPRSQLANMSNSLRLVSYNILEGLRPVAPQATERRHIDRQSSEAALGVVKALSPDILVLNEALFCRQYRGKVVDYARLFGFPYEAAALY